MLREPLLIAKIQTHFAEFRGATISDSSEIFKEGITPEAANVYPEEVAFSALGKVRNTLLILFYQMESKTHASGAKVRAGKGGHSSTLPSETSGRIRASKEEEESSS